MTSDPSFTITACVGFDDQADTVERSFLRKVIRNEADFNSVVQQIIKHLHKEGSNSPTSLFSKERGALTTDIPERVIITPWGGVHIVQRADPRVEKFLIVNKEKYLAFEKHEVKEETLVVQEGEGVLLHSSDQKSITMYRITSGFEKYIAPGEEHCIIATTDLLVFEKSMDYKGMDKDLIFLYLPENS